jgi:hypothetical protein
VNYYTADTLPEVLPPKVRNEQVWHYTSSAAVLGLLSTGGLWVSSARSLNDSGEIDYGSEIIMRRWESQRERFTSKDLMDEFLEAGYESRQQDLFVACASTEGDSLSQFRAYGSYAVGLNAGVPLRPVRDRTNDDTFGFSSPSDLSADMATRNGWRPVLYDLPGQLELVDHFFQYLDETINQAPVSPHEEDPTEGLTFAREAAASQFLAVAAHLKHQAFADEHEVRLFAQMSLFNPAVKIRDGRLGLTPYFAAEPDPGPGSEPQFRSMLTRVKIGPGLTDAQAAQEGLEMALSKFAIAVPVETLEIPLR